jgi:hypothetical protein
MAKPQHCPEGCIYCRQSTLFAWRCTRSHEVAPLWTLYEQPLKTIDDKPVRTTHCVREGLPEGVKEVE